MVARAPDYHRHVPIRAELRPRGPFSLRLSGRHASDATRVVADGLAVSSAASSYVAAHGTLPKSLGDLPSLTKDQRTDPWGTPYAFSPGPGPNEFTLISAGPDRTLGTDDDPKVHETISRGTP